LYHSDIGVLLDSLGYLVPYVRPTFRANVVRALESFEIEV